MWSRRVSPQTSLKPTITSPTTLVTGTYWAAKSFQEARSLSTQSGYWSCSRVLLLVESCVSPRATPSIFPATTWHQLVADDYHLKASGPEYRSAPVVFFVPCVAWWVPFSRSKTAEDDLVSWVGFEFIHSSHKLGISQKRADWFAEWTDEISKAQTVNITSFERRTWTSDVRRRRAQARATFPFSTVHTYELASSRCSPVRSFLRSISADITTAPLIFAPRVDAQPSEDRTGIGGWIPQVDEHGQLDTCRSRWLSHETTRDAWSWIFEKREIARLS